jgi:hypothetical protein
MVAEDLVKEVKPLMGTFSEASAISKTNTLVLTDTIRCLKRISTMLAEAEKSNKSQTGAGSGIMGGPLLEITFGTPASPEERIELAEAQGA